MNIKLTLYLIVTGFLVCYTKAYSQNKIKLDTINYLVDTSKIPVQDRLMIFGQEGDFYGYRINCQCFPWQTDPIFTYHIKQKGVNILEADLKNYQFITLRKLIEIAVQFGQTRQKKTAFFFFEKTGQQYVKHQVFLSEPRQPLTGY
jgi:hypothetical protein